NAPWSAIENVSGTSGADTLTSNALGNTLAGGAGHENYIFHTPPAQGSDTITHTKGNQTPASSAPTHDVPRDARITGHRPINPNLNLTAPWSVIENAFGGNGKDKLFGNSLNNTLKGGAGDDVLDGNAGTDSLDAGDGNDRLSEFGGTALMLGGNGDDTLTG